ncbi:MAG: heavy metal translocating P-type ATPase, partial [Erysipelothrix sp.]|nr:heavy metal translocating P-type ATPase [Erysipelothrix sp.]
MKNKNHNNHDHDTMHDHSHHDHSGHDHDHSGLGGHDMGNLKLMFFVSLIFAVPVMILSPMMGLTLPFQVYFEGSEWIVMILSTILFIYGGRPFFTHAKMEIEMKSPGMMTLISLGISVSYVYSMYAFTSNIILKQNLHLMDFFFELASLIVIMLLGHWIENSAIASAGNALEKMAQLLPSSAYVVQKDGSTKEVPLVDVQIDDVVIVRSGENMPVDGLIVSGSSTVNESMITGEALAIKKDVGDTVIGGSINGAGTLQVKVVGTGESGYLASVMKLVSEAQNDQSKRETLSQVV